MKFSPKKNSEPTRDSQAEGRVRNDPQIDLKTTEKHNKNKQFLCFRKALGLGRAAPGAPTLKINLKLTKNTIKTHNFYALGGTPPPLGFGGQPSSKIHKSTHKTARGKEPTSPQETHKRPTKAFTAPL